MGFNTLNLYPVNVDGLGYERLLKEIEEFSRKGKIYFTFCEYEGQRYELSTTEPKVQLDISQYREWARNYLCHRIEMEFQRSESDGRIVVSICPSGNEGEYLRNYWVSRTVGREGAILYHLSSVYRNG